MPMKDTQKYDYLTSYHAIEERLKNGGKAFGFFYTRENDRITRLIELAEKRHLMVKKVDKEDLRDFNYPAFVLEIPLDDFKGGQDWFKKRLARLEEKEKSLVLILNEITDPHNLGAILRSACQFGVDLVIYGERRSASGDTDTVARSSAGASEIISHGSISNINNALSEFKKLGYWIYACDTGGKPLTKQKFTSKTVLVLGNEGKGISQLTKKQCDEVISINTTDRLDSLNVSVAAGIVMHHYYSSNND